METIPVIFGRNNLPFSWVIRAFTWSRYSHCGIIDKTGRYVIEATASKGVVVTTIDEFKRRYKSHEVLNMPVTCKANAYKLAYTEIGRAYDWAAVFSLVTRANWENSAAWFCSELIAHCSGLYRPDRIRRITPEHIFMLCK